MASLSAHLKSELEKRFGFQVRGDHPLSGGCINPSIRLYTSEGLFFLKWNDANKFPAMFEKEALGLQELSNSQTLKIPQVIGQGEVEGTSYLLLEYLEESSGSTKAWQQMGYQLAQLHQHTQEHFGFKTSNYIGSLPQQNHSHADWISFFREERLMPQVHMAVQKGLIYQDVQRQFDLLYQKLPELLSSKSEPSLLHGDLWSGNVLITVQDIPCLVDPAVYYGHREADLAFTHLFGGFPSAFYEAYQEAFPLEAGYEQRVDLFNLYPLLVHLNLFGEGYLANIKSILGSLV